MRDLDGRSGAEKDGIFRVLEALERGREGFQESTFGKARKRMEFWARRMDIT